MPLNLYGCHKSILHFQSFQNGIPFASAHSIVRDGTQCVAIIKLYQGQWIRLHLALTKCLNHCLYYLMMTHLVTLSYNIVLQANPMLPQLPSAAVILKLDCLFLGCMHTSHCIQPAKCALPRISNPVCKSRHA